MAARKLACDGCRKSKVRCDGQEGVSTCSRCAKKSIECTWDTPRSKRGRKSHNNRLNTESGMGLFCLTPKNLIELNYTRSPPEPGEHPQHHSTPNSSLYSNQLPPQPSQENWQLPLPLYKSERFLKPKSSSLEGLPSLHKIHLISPRSQRPRSLDELGMTLSNNTSPSPPATQHHSHPQSGSFVSLHPSHSPFQSPTTPAAVAMDNGESGKDMEIENGEMTKQQFNNEMTLNSLVSVSYKFPSPVSRSEQNSPLLSQEEAVRKKCSIGALINTDQDQDNYMFQKYPSKK